MAYNADHLEKMYYIVVIVPNREKDPEVYVDKARLTGSQASEVVDVLHEKLIAGEIYNYRVLPIEIFDEEIVDVDQPKYSKWVN